MRTWILVALRAATEPVKEEAMQAIFLEVVLCVVCVKRVLEVETMRARNSFCIEIRIPTIPNSEPRPLNSAEIDFPRSDWPRAESGQSTV